MRIRRRYAVLAFASVAALAVAGIASANHVSNTSTLPTWNVTPGALPGSGGGGANGGSGTTAPVPARRADVIPTTRTRATLPRAVGRRR